MLVRDDDLAGAGAGAGAIVADGGTGSAAAVAARAGACDPGVNVAVGAGASTTRKSPAGARRSSHGKRNPGKPKVCPSSEMLNNAACKASETSNAPRSRQGKGLDAALFCVCKVELPE